MITNWVQERRITIFLWVIILLTVVVGTWAVAYYPLVTVLILGVTAVSIGCLMAPRSNRVGIGVAGALAAVVLVPAGVLPIDVLGSIIGSVLGLLWLLLFVLLAWRKMTLRRPAILWITIFAVGLAGATVSERADPFAIITACFIAVLAWASSAMTRQESRIVRGTIIALALAQAVLTSIESIVIGHPLLKEEAYGINPLIPGAMRGEGTLGHPLVASLVILAGAGLVLTWKRHRILKWVTVGFLGLGAVATGSSSVATVLALCVIYQIVRSGTLASRFFKIIAVGLIGFFMATRPLIYSAIAEDIGGINAVHRINSLLAVPRLISERTLPEVFFGSGWGSAAALYEDNVLINDNFYAIDNQFTTILAAAGLIGFSIFVWFLLLAVVRGAPEIRVALVGIIAMFAAFDVLNWAASGAIFVTLAIIAATRPKCSRRQIPQASNPRVQQAI